MPSKSEILLTKHNLHQSHWGKRIIKAASSNPPSFTLGDTHDAGDWSKCACGKALNPVVMEHAEHGNHPSDPYLGDLGTRFYVKVAEHCPLEAAETLIEIEHRAEELAKRNKK